MKFRKPWLLALTLSLLSSPLQAEDTLTFHVYRSPGIQWTHPRSLARSTIRHRKAPYPIGHVTVELKCGERTLRSGMVYRYANESARVIRKEKQGLGVLFHDFRGLLQSDSWVRASVRRFQTNGRLGVIRIKVSPASCQRMIEFQENYTLRGMGRHYGTLSRPLQGEGGGCSAYAMAYPEVAGFLEPWMIRRWARTHRVPLEAVGGPLTKRPIPLLKLLNRAPRSWAEESEPSFPFFLYDPDRMYRWIQTMQTRPSPGVRPVPVTRELLGVPLMKKARAIAVELDRSEVQPPSEINYHLGPSDPSEPQRNPPLLETWWAKEIRILK